MAAMATPHHHDNETNFLAMYIPVNSTHFLTRVHDCLSATIQHSIINSLKIIKVYEH